MVKGALRQLLSVELSSGKTPSSDRMVHGEKFSSLSSYRLVSSTYNDKITHPILAENSINSTWRNISQHITTEDADRVDCNMDEDDKSKCHIFTPRRTAV